MTDTQKPKDDVPEVIKTILIDNIYHTSSLKEVTDPKGTERLNKEELPFTMKYPSASVENPSVLQAEIVRLQSENKELRLELIRKKIELSVAKDAMQAVKRALYDTQTYMTSVEENFIIQDESEEEEEESEESDEESGESGDQDEEDEEYKHNHCHECSNIVKDVFPTCGACNFVYCLNCASKMANPTSLSSRRSVGLKIYFTCSYCRDQSTATPADS